MDIRLDKIILISLFYLERQLFTPAGSAHKMPVLSISQFPEFFIDHLTIKLTGGNGAQRNCRPVERIVMRSVNSPNLHAPAGSR